VGFPETPDTDVMYIKRELNRLNDNIEGLNDRLDKQALGINDIGKNQQWIVDNVSGIFQMFGSPQFMSQMTNMMMGANLNADGTESDAAADAGTGNA